MVSLTQRINYSSECQSRILAPLSDSFSYIFMCISLKRLYMLVTLSVAPLDPRVYMLSIFKCACPVLISYIIVLIDFV